MIYNFKYSNVILDEILLKYNNELTYIYARIKYDEIITKSFLGFNINTTISPNKIENIYANETHFSKFGDFDKHWKFLDTTKNMPEDLNIEINRLYDNLKAQKILKGE